MTFATTRLVVSATLEGYINALVPGGKFENCCIGFRLNPNDLAKFEATYAKALAEVAKEFKGKRFEKALPKWQEDGFVKYNYGGEDNAPMFPFVDADGAPVAIDTDVRAGTKVRLIIDLKGYVYANKGGLSFKIRGCQIIELATGGGAFDSGSLDANGVADIFGKTTGFAQHEPAVRGPEADTADSDDDDLPF